jgi:hypothetical protein
MEALGLHDVLGDLSAPLRTPVIHNDQPPVNVGEGAQKAVQLGDLPPEEILSMGMLMGLPDPVVFLVDGEDGRERHLLFDALNEELRLGDFQYKEGENGRGPSILRKSFSRASKSVLDSNFSNNSSTFSSTRRRCLASFRSTWDGSPLRIGSVMSTVLSGK